MDIVRMRMNRPYSKVDVIQMIIHMTLNVNERAIEMGFPTTMCQKITRKAARRAGPTSNSGFDDFQPLPSCRLDLPLI